jgi:hypothetical protein
MSNKFVIVTTYHRHKPSEFTYHIVVSIANSIFSELAVLALYEIYFTYPLGVHRSRGSSGSIVSDYWLDDRAIGVRSSAGAKDFSSNLCIQTGSEAHPASFTVSTGGPFPGVKSRPGSDADHSPPSSAEVVNE